VLGPQGLYVALREVGMELDLVHRGHHAGAVEQASEVIDHEVADPIARTLPSASRVSNARYASSVVSNSEGSDPRPWRTRTCQYTDHHILAKSSASCSDLPRWLAARR
jgi:hypothetical protein